MMKSGLRKQQHDEGGDEEGTSRKQQTDEVTVWKTFMETPT